jgi:hypothetical protein
MVVVCGVPLVAAIDAAGPDVFVRLKVVDADTPETVAVTA